jgi:hypothetical protein
VNRAEIILKSKAQEDTPISGKSYWHLEVFPKQFFNLKNPRRKVSEALSFG